MTPKIEAHNYRCVSNAERGGQVGKGTPMWFPLLKVARADRAVAVEVEGWE